MGKKALLEAVLFLSGKALTERQLAEATGMEVTTVKRLLTSLVREYSERGGALEIARRGRRWVLQVREEYLAAAAQMAPSTLPVSVLKTASLIAYYQPVKQSRLVAMLGPKVYDHVRKLREKSLVSARPSGRTVELYTTSKFLDFFGIAAGNREELRKLMEKRVQRQGGQEPTSGLIISS